MLVSNNLESLINIAHRARKGIIPEGTDAYRIFDGIGDGRDGVFVDDFAGRWLVSHRGARPGGLSAAALGCKGLWFKQLDQDDKQSPQPAVAGFEGDREFEVCESGVRYHIDFGAGYSQGLFLDQRENRREVARRSAGERILNCFSYTCGFSVAAAVAGAESTTSIDLSRPYLDWGKRNFELNGIDVGSAEHYFCRGEVFEWLGQFARKGRQFGGVVLDPPTFSRSKQSGAFSVEKDYAALAEAAARVIGKGGWMLACCNHRGLAPARFEAMVREGVRVAGRTVRDSRSLPMPADFSGEPYLKSYWVDL